MHVGASDHEVPFLQLGRLSITAPQTQEDEGMMTIFRVVPAPMRCRFQAAPRQRASRGEGRRWSLRSSNARARGSSSERISAMMNARWTSNAAPANNRA